MVIFNWGSVSENDISYVKAIITMDKALLKLQKEQRE